MPRSGPLSVTTVTYLVLANAVTSQPRVVPQIANSATITSAKSFLMMSSSLRPARGGLKRRGRNILRYTVRSGRTDRRAVHHHQTFRGRFRDSDAASVASVSSLDSGE